MSFKYQVLSQSRFKLKLKLILADLLQLRDWFGHKKINCQQNKGKKFQIKMTKTFLYKVITGGKA